MCDNFVIFICLFFFFKQKTAYEMRISDWSSDVCSSDLLDDAADLLQVDLRLEARQLALDDFADLSGLDHLGPLGVLFQAFARRSFIFSSCPSDRKSVV